MTTLLALLAFAPAPLTFERSVDLPKTGGFDALAFDAERRRVLAAHSGANALAVLDVRTGKVTEVETGSINGIAVSDRLDRYFVAGGDKTLVSIDRKTLEIVGRRLLSGPADLMAIDPKRGHILVGHDDGAELWAFDAATLKPLGTVAIEEAPEFVAYDRKTDRIYQNVKTTDHLQVVDPASLKVVATWSTAPMKSPHGLAIDEKAGKAYAAGRNGKLVSIDLATGKLLKAIDVAPGIDQIGIDPGLGRVYCPGAGKMTIVSTATGSVLGEIDLPKGARNVAVDPTSHTVWMASTDAKGAHLLSFKAR